MSMVDEASDPQVDFADLLITACYATPASDSASANLPAEETTAPAETSGGQRNYFKLFLLQGLNGCLKSLKMLEGFLKV